MATSSLVRLCIYVPGTFYANPFKPFLNAVAGSSYGIAYGHFRRDHSDPLNVWLHVGCLFLQIFGNFALLDCLDRTLGTRSVAPFTAAAWALALGRTPSPPSVRAFTIALLAVASRGCAALAPSSHYASLMLLTGPLELICYWLYLPDHNLKRPGAPWFCAALAARTACCLFLRDHVGLLGVAPAVGAAAVLALLMVASLVRSRNNLPLVSQFGSALWIPALLLDQPWVYFLSLSFMGAGLQGVAHEITRQKGTLNQLTDAGYELAHTSFFPVLTLQSLHHSSYGPYAATVAALGTHGDARSRRALGLRD